MSDIAQSLCKMDSSLLLVKQKLPQTKLSFISRRCYNFTFTAMIQRIITCETEGAEHTKNRGATWPFSCQRLVSLVCPDLYSSYRETELVLLFVSCRLISSGSLRKLLAGWNEVCQLAERIEGSQVEVLDLQHNHLAELPHNFFIKAQRCTFFPSYLLVFFIVSFVQKPPCLLCWIVVTACGT